MPASRSTTGPSVPSNPTGRARRRFSTRATAAVSTAGTLANSTSGHATVQRRCRRRAGRYRNEAYVTEPLDLPWEWKYSDEAGVGVPGPEVTFDSQESAEAWL